MPKEEKHCESFPDNISFQPPPGDPVRPLRGPVDQAGRAVQRENLQGNLYYPVPLIAG